MRNIAEISKDLSAKVNATKKLDRKTDEAAFDAAMAEVKALVQELNDARAIEAAEQAAAARQLQNLEAKENRRFSITKFLREAAAGKLSGLEAEVAEMGAKEYERMGLSRKGFVIPMAALRGSAGQNYTTDADGGYAKETAAPTYLDGLKERLVVSKLGAHVLGDLVGTIPFVSAGAISASWLAEGAEASVSKSTFAKVSLTPHRNAVVGAFSKDLLRQTSIDIDNVVMGLLLDAHATLIESACIAGSGSSNQPTGILNTAGIGEVIGGTNGAPISWGNVVKLETAINANNANRGKLGYLTNAKVIGAMKTTEKASNTARFVLDFDGSLNGYPVEWTNLVPSNLTKGSSEEVCSAMIFGNFDDLYVGHWGGIDVVVDPYTLAASADVRIVLNSWDDCIVVNPKSFAAIKDITTA